MIIVLMIAWLKRAQNLIMLIINEIINLKKTPELSDAKYDLLEDELKKLDPNNPVFSIFFQRGLNKKSKYRSN